MDMSIRSEHVHGLEMWKFFKFWVAIYGRGNVERVPIDPFISYSCISYFGHACLKFILFLFELVNV